MADSAYESIRSAISSMPVIDCHEHMEGPPKSPDGGPAEPMEPIASLVQGYVASDLISAAWGVPEDDVYLLQDSSVSTDEKWPL